MAVLSPTTSALAFHASVALLSGLASDDDTADLLCSAEMAALDVAIAAPARTMTDVRSKIMTLFAGAGCGLVEVEHLAFVARDLETLIARVQ